MRTDPSIAPCGGNQTPTAAKATAAIKAAVDNDLFIPPQRLEGIVAAIIVIRRRDATAITRNDA